MIIADRKATIRLATLITILGSLIWSNSASAFEPSGELEIHYINVGQGGSTLIIGPNGTRILYDFGKRDGSRDIIPYLREKVGIAPTDGIHYAFVSHYDLDHYVGYKALVDDGFDFLVANYGPDKNPPDKDTLKKDFLDPARHTTAGEVRGVPVGLSISLGSGAEVIVMAAAGKVYGQQAQVDITNENDRSIALFIQYGKFQYLLDGDLGAGAEECTNHDTSQKDVQTKVADALIKLKFISEEHGVDVLHIAHHGSESSTSAAYFNVMKPEVGLISVGLNQGTFRHPREDVVDRVLLGPDRPACVKAPALKALFQTEDGKGMKDESVRCSSTGCTSFSGQSVGDIKLTTDGVTGYRIQGDNRVHGGSKEAGAPVEFSFDEDSPSG